MKQQQPGRLQYRNKRIKLRGFTVVNNNVSLSIVPMPAVYKENEGSFSVDKVGYVTFEF
jgi:hypothetical protein